MTARFCRAQLARIVLVDLDRCWTVASSDGLDSAPREGFRKNSLYEWSIGSPHEVSVVPDLDHVLEKSDILQQGGSEATMQRDCCDLDRSHMSQGRCSAKKMQRDCNYLDTTNLSHRKSSSKNIRFFAGAPLVNEEGYVLGVIAVLDENPRVGMTLVEQDVLRDLAQSIMDLMEEKRRQLFNGVNGHFFHPGLLRSARFVTSHLEMLRADRDLHSMARHHQNTALESAHLSAKYLSTALKPVDYDQT